MTKRFGFTLAEVLITLGIIGVVAAMTMPTLINQTNGAQYKAAYKKALSAISQAVTLNVALDDIGFADTVAGTVGRTTKPSSGVSVGSLLGERMNVVNQLKTDELPTAYKTTLAALTINGFHTCTAAETTTESHACNGKEAGDTVEGTTISPDTYLFFNDGSMFAFKNADATACTQASNATNGNKTCYGVIDVNGAKGPNKLVTCDGTTSGANCEVKSPTDIYPVEFYDQTIVPASYAARAVLYGK